MTCSNCETSNREVAKFCDNCGHKLAELAPSTAPSPDLNRFIPQALAKKIEATRESGAMQGERRVVTMLFCDVKGSTAAAEKLDPEEWTHIINGAFEHMIKPVYHYEGTVARLMGDSILAFFGAPIAHEDDAQRAVLAGLDIVSGFATYKTETLAKWNLAIDARVGINTGMVVVGAVGSDMRMEYTAMGDAINLAARMEQTALPGTVQIAEDTYKLVAPLFDFKALGGVKVKGKDEPVPSYQVLKTKATPGRVRGLELHGVHSELVGRHRELAQLKASLLELITGKSSIFTLVGEAGLGKSRLIDELERYSKQYEAQILWLKGATLSFGQSISYWPFQEMIKGYAGITESDTELRSWQKLELKIKTLFKDDSDEILPYIASLISLDLSDVAKEQVENLDGEAMGQQLYRATRQFFERLAEQQAIVLCFEDLHWIDESSLKLIEHLFPLSARVPILFLVTTRDEPTSLGVKLRQFAQADYSELYREIELLPLNANDSDLLIGNLMAQAKMPASLRNTIIQKADGNPFYVEEIIRSLIDSGNIIFESKTDNWQVRGDVSQINIPDTLQGVILSRIDRLEDNVKQVLSRAAVIGRAFFFRVLEALDSTNPNLREELSILQRIELIDEQDHASELEYIFKHAMAHEVTYENILLKRRRSIHARVGSAIESLFADRLDEFYGVLAYHFSRAENAEKAQEYLLKAADQAEGISANAEALNHYQQALEAYQRSLGKDVDKLQIAELELKMGKVLRRLGETAASVARLERATALIGKGIPTKKWAVRWALVKEGSKQFAYQVAPKLLLSSKEKTLSKAEQLEIEAAQEMAHAIFVIDGERAFEAMLRGLNRSSQLNHKSSKATGLAGLALVWDSLGQTKLVKRYNQQALKLAEEIQEDAPWAVVHMVHGVSALSTGDPDLIRYHSDLGMKTSSVAGETTPFSISFVNLCVINCFQGNFDTAASLIEEKEKMDDDSGNTQMLMHSLYYKAWYYRLQGKITEALELLATTSLAAEKLPDYSMSTVTNSQLLHCYLDEGQLEKALELVGPAQSLLDTHPVHYLSTTALLSAITRTYLVAAERASDEGSVEGLNHTDWLKKAGHYCTKSANYGKSARLLLAEALRYQGSYEWLRKKPAKAKHWWQQSIDFAKEKGLKPDEALTLFEMGQRLKNEALIAQALSMMDEIGMAYPRTQLGLSLD